jgi:drug/metabolite transporter (DMT)-like permease
VPIKSTYPWVIVSIFAGSLVAPAIVFYNKAMRLEEASRVGSIINIGLVFVAVLAFAFLGESLTPAKCVGIFSLIAGATIISYKRLNVSKKLVLSSAIALLIAYAFIWAAASVLTKYILNFIDFWSFYAWGLTGTFLGSILMLAHPRIRRDFFSDMKKAKDKTLLYVLLTSAAFYIGDFSFTFALWLGAVSLVSALSSIQPFFVLLFASMISMLKPRVLKEQLDKFSILSKIVAISLIFLGMYLVTA